MHIDILYMELHLSEEVTGEYRKLHNGFVNYAVYKILLGWYN